VNGEVVTVINNASQSYITDGEGPAHTVGCGKLTGVNASAAANLEAFVRVRRGRNARTRVSSSATVHAIANAIAGSDGGGRVHSGQPCRPRSVSGGVDGVRGRV